MGQPVVHWELMSKEPEKVAAFYERIFDWKITLNGLWKPKST